ncbi:TPA: DUF2207 domain-containing protein [Serratia fonticola]
MRLLFTRWKVAMLLFLSVLLPTFVIASPGEKPRLQAPPAAEAIARFDVQATMQPDNSMDVLEQIVLQARNKEINYGFYRTLPLRWLRPDGKNAILQYQVNEVLRDGKPEPWRLKHRNGNLEIVIGDGQKQLAPGDYQYQIHYQISNHFIRGKQGDLLLWNVTGDDWRWPIYQAHFTLKLPDADDWIDSQGRDPRIKYIDFFTGFKGQKLKQGRINPDGSIDTLLPLGNQTGITVVYSWPRSVLSPTPAPETTTLFEQLFIPSATSLILWLPCLVLALSCLMLWLRRPQEIPRDIPLYHDIPAGLSPGFLRLERENVYDEKAFCADIVNLISQKVIMLEQVESSDDPQRLSLAPQAQWLTQQLSADEQKLKDLLFSKTSTLLFTGKRNKVLRKAFLGMGEHYAPARQGDCYRSGWILTLAIMAITSTLAIAFYCTASWRMADVLTDLIPTFFFTLLLCITAMVLATARDTGRSLMRPAIKMMILTLVVSALPVAFYLFYSNNPHYWFMPSGYYSALIVSGYVGALGYAMMPRYTASGQIRAAQAEGVVQLLEKKLKEAPRKSAHKSQLDASWLAWAVAVDLGDSWARALEKQLGRAINVPEIIRSPTLSLLLSHCSQSGASFSGGSFGGGFSSGGGSGGGGGGGW